MPTNPHTSPPDAVEPIALRYIDIGSDLLCKTLLAPSGTARAAALRALDRLGIAPRAGEGALDAWLRVMAQDNGLPVTRPAHRRLVDAVLSDAGAARFMFALA